MTTDTVDGALADQPVSLVQAVTLLLTKHQHPRPQDWLAGVDPRLSDETLDQNEQRALINRYWRMQIQRLGSINTMEVRFCLVETGAIADWLRLYDTYAIPWIVKNNLPLS